MYKILGFPLVVRKKGMYLVLYPWLGRLGSGVDRTPVWKKKLIFVRITSNRLCRCLRVCQRSKLVWLLVHAVSNNGVGPHHQELAKPCTVRLFCIIDSHPYHSCIYACIVTGYVETVAYYNEFVSSGCIKVQESLFHSSMTSDCAYIRGSRVLLLTVASDKVLASSCKCQAKLKSGWVG